MIVIPSLLENVCKDHGQQFVDHSGGLDYLFWTGGKIVALFV